MIHVLACLLLSAPSIDGPESFGEHSLAVYTARELPENAAASWEVLEPDASVHECGGNLILAGPPGRYRIVLSLISIADGRPRVAKLRRTVEVKAKTPPAPPMPPDKPVPPPPDKPVPPDKKPDPAAAVGRFAMNRSGCTATVIGPRRADGKWDVLCASHCVADRSGKAKLQLKDGRVLALTLTKNEAASDISWWTTDDATLELPFANLAAAAPPAGTKIWHCGYGVDKPGNREEGTVSGAIDGKGMLPMRLNVSSGDSGGGIFRVDNGELVACVCCTRARGAFADVWGGSSVRAAAIRPASATPATPAPDEFDWVPHPIPVRPEGEMRHSRETAHKLFRQILAVHHGRHEIDAPTVVVLERLALNVFPIGGADDNECPLPPHSPRLKRVGLFPALIFPLNEHRSPLSSCHPAAGTRSAWSECYSPSTRERRRAARPTPCARWSASPSSSGARGRC